MFTRFAPLRRKETRTLDLGDCIVPVTFRTNKRARSIILRIDAKTGGAIITLPQGVSLKEGLSMARRKATWIRSRIAALPAAKPFGDGMSVPLLGTDCCVRHRPDCRGTVWREGDEIHVAGKVEHLPRRLNDWLRSEARQEFTTRSQHYAKRLGVTLGRITVRDTRSRWGSCSVNGSLSFSWRLILAPEWVLDYVVAHEVAHRVAHHHGPEFWTALAEIVDDVKKPQRWLKQHGTQLHRFGA